MQQTGNTARSECNTPYSCEEDEEREEEERSGRRNTSEAHTTVTPTAYTTAPTTSTIGPTTTTHAVPTTTALHHSSPSPCFRCPGGSCSPSRKFFCPHFCVLTQTDVARWLLDRAPQQEPVPSRSLLDLGLIHPRIVTVKCSDNAYEALQLLQSSAGDVSAVAVVDPSLGPASSAAAQKSNTSQYDSYPNGKLVGQLSSVDLRGCTAQFAAQYLRAMTVHQLLLAVPATERYWRSREKGEKMRLLQPLEQQQVKEDKADTGGAFANPAAALSAVSPYNVGQLRPVSKCKPGSNLCAAMAQALAHRNHRVWVVDQDGCPTGVVTFSDMISAFLSNPSVDAFGA
ncbi:hypothetical protein CLOM_g7323 [Closterium sp. NIES-68]|nr:hypothetical protein CLOM_g7323 [Closterium sp. NIES-68]GJP62618.1 hypothetical protein CLOP_g19656 [Closterium sp. NIES-67]